MVPDALGHLEVWLVTGSQEMYGPETLRQVEAHAREVAAGLGAQPAVPVRMVHADVLGRPIGVAASQNAPALGAAMFGAAAGGACRSIGEVSERMAAVAAGTYLPVDRRSSYQGGEVDPGALGHTPGEAFLDGIPCQGGSGLPVEVDDPAMAAERGQLAFLERAGRGGAHVSLDVARSSACPG